jgi:uncharacterized membrane protein YcjF (UPF0283 family)
VVGVVKFEIRVDVGKTSTMIGLLVIELLSQHTWNNWQIHQLQISAFCKVIVLLVLDSTLIIINYGMLVINKKLTQDQGTKAHLFYYMD